MKKTTKKIWLGILVVLALAFGIFIYGGWSMFGDELKAIKTLHQVQDSVYTYTFRGDYGFKGFLEQGGAKTDGEMSVYIAKFLSHGYMDPGKPAPAKAGCTSIRSGNLFARNFDFQDQGQHLVIVRTEPKDGYKSISTSTFAFLGFGNDWHPVAGMDGMTALATTYVPLDGMNEKGLCVADLIEIDGDTVPFDTPKPDLTIVSAIRLVLDYAATVDEAVRLLAKYDVHGSIGAAHHLAIADASRSVVVEWQGSQMHVTDTPVVANHCLWQPTSHPLIDNSKERLATIGAQHPVNASQAMAALQSVSAGSTLWSVVFDRKKLTGTWYFRRHWEKPVTMPLQDD